MKIESRKSKTKVGVSLMPTEDFRFATESLFSSNSVEVVEWSFDTVWIGKGVAPWCQQIIDEFSDIGSLLGHGVNLSSLSARFTERQKDWLERARDEFKSRHYVHCSEHFGFSEGGPFAHGAPMAVPLNKQSLRVGQEMLRRLADTTQVPVGLENLAFAFSLEDVNRQGEFIEELLAPVDGFLVLDLHNIFCQIANFGVQAHDLLNSYPLDRVKEIHISGGSWSPSYSGKRAAVRRDTHDDAVPEEVFILAQVTLEYCPTIEYAILERLGNTMPTEIEQQSFRDDFMRLKNIVELVEKVEYA